MRRLLYLALALVLLALAGLVFVRVTSSGAYIARARAMRIHQGMTRREVEQILTGIRKLDDLEWTGRWCGVWTFENSPYELTVHYDDAGGDPASHRVKQAYLDQTGEATHLDRALELLGYPKARLVITGPGGVPVP